MIEKPQSHRIYMQIYFECEPTNIAYTTIDVDVCFVCRWVKLSTKHKLYFHSLQHFSLCAVNFGNQSLFIACTQYTVHYTQCTHIMQSYTVPRTLALFTAALKTINSDTLTHHNRMSSCIKQVSTAQAHKHFHSIERSKTKRSRAEHSD